MANVKSLINYNRLLHQYCMKCKTMTSFKVCVFCGKFYCLNCNTQCPRCNGRDDKFMGYVSKQTNGCWDWCGTISKKGYGVFWNGTKLVAAHRYSYEKVKCKIPDGLQIDHLCRNRRCVNPDHLEVVTLQENVARGMVSDFARDKQVSKTHCKHGHPYNGKNTYIRPDRGTRECKRCLYETTKRLRQQKRMANRD